MSGINSSSKNHSFLQLKWGLVQENSHTLGSAEQQQFLGGPQWFWWGTCAGVGVITSWHKQTLNGFSSWIKGDFAMKSHWQVELRICGQNIFIFAASQGEHCLCTRSVQMLHLLVSCPVSRAALCRWCDAFLQCVLVWVPLEPEAAVRCTVMHCV